MGPLLSFLGLAAGIIGTYLSFRMTGAGHGWLTPFWVTWVSMLVGPLTGVAWEQRTRTGGKMAWWLLGVLVLFDCPLFGFSLQERYYIAVTWQHVPGSVLGWAVSWALVHAEVVVAITAVGKRFRERLG
jgi:hypothetical protein